MDISLKKILKQSNILYLSTNEKLCKKTISTLKIFFKKIIFRDDIEKAIDDYNNTNIHAIITEIDFYKSNGVIFIKEIRKLNKNIPIIVLTESKEIDTVIELIKFNLTDYLLKPTNSSKLISALNRCAKQIYNNGEIINKINKNASYNYLNKNIQINNLEIDLTRNEALLFELLLANKNKIVKTHEIKKYIWTNKEVSDSAFKTLFSRLTKKIGKDIITNSFGVGYGVYDK